MNLTDAMLVLLLAARIHGTDDGVRAAAKSVVKKIPRSKRDGIYKVIDSKSPLKMVELIAEHIEL
jgi:site-specific DNA-cytosine methylase